jgi:hypothetical protein
MDSKAVAAFAKLIITASGLTDSISGTPLPMGRLDHEGEILETVVT